MFTLINLKVGGGRKKYRENHMGKIKIIYSYFYNGQLREANFVRRNIHHSMDKSN